MKEFIKRIFRKSTTEEFRNVEIELTENWIKYNNGNSIGKKGSEGGKILNDQENINGARITIEANVGNIPFAITLGIYGLIVHTEFFSEIEIAAQYFKRKKNEIDRILKMFEIPEDNQDTEWENKKDEYLEKLMYE
ncbi:hypothetical protein Q1W71_03715 [Flavobacterium pectinovorum]|uniref:hypothetical protein n=1 Tax=Flavobacterium pectinovorum TaxID=29533 RepID=UPI00265FA3DC|nr:hypothetical protein [Flavobacterium pectinovorum]WKL48895.1 hypothetical protein Q1W71_03715 [Flavobacterium pectinovorum]